MKKGANRQGRREREREREGTQYEKKERRNEGLKRRRREEEQREDALKRVIRSRGRYQVQTSFGAYGRSAPAADLQMATRTRARRF